jgi:uncharacterized membrane protein
MKLMNLPGPARTHDFFYGFGGMILTNVTMTMLTEFTPKNSTIGVAVNYKVDQSPLEA